MLIKHSFITHKLSDLHLPVVIVGGEDFRNNELDTVEVVDNNANCEVDPFPMRLSGAAGVNGLICGGQDYEFNVLSSCWHLNPSGTWTAGEDMLKQRKDLTLSIVKENIIAIGGRTTNFVALRSMEKYSLSKDEGWLRMKDAPTTIYRHCTVMINSSYLMVIGGYQSNQVIKLRCKF